MKYLLLFLALGGLARAADRSELVWHGQLAPASPRPGDTAELIVAAELPPHALVYSSDFKSDIGPQPTVLDLAGSEGIELIGPVRSVEAKRKHDKTWDIELGYFEARAELRQTVRIVRPDFVLRGKVAGQLCDEKEGTCTLFTERLSVVPAGK